MLMLTSLVFLEVVSGPVGSAVPETEKMGQKAVFYLEMCKAFLCPMWDTFRAAVSEEMSRRTHPWGARWNHCISEEVGSMEGTTLSRPAFKVLFKSVSSLQIRPCLVTDLLLGSLL